MYNIYSHETLSSHAHGLVYQDPNPTPPKKTLLIRYSVHIYNTESLLSRMLKEKKSVTISRQGSGCKQSCVWQHAVMFFNLVENLWGKLAPSSDHFEKRLTQNFIIIYIVFAITSGRWYRDFGFPFSTHFLHVRFLLPFSYSILTRLWILCAFGIKMR